MKAIAQMNFFMTDNIETVFLLTEAEYSPISSTVVREILRYGGDVSVNFCRVKLILPIIYHNVNAPCGVFFIFLFSLQNK